MHGGKYRNISAIYRVSGGVDTIFHGEKLEMRYFRKYRQNIGDISVRGNISEIFSKNRLWWQKIDDISEIYRRYIGSRRYIGDFFKKSPPVAKNR